MRKNLINTEVMTDQSLSANHFIYKRLEKGDVLFIENIASSLLAISMEGTILVSDESGGVIFDDFCESLKIFDVNYIIFEAKTDSILMLNRIERKTISAILPKLGLRSTIQRVDMLPLNNSLKTFVQFSQKTDLPRREIFNFDLKNHIFMVEMVRKMVKIYGIDKISAFFGHTIPNYNVSTIESCMKKLSRMELANL